jgi:hypothetical protein
LFLRRFEKIYELSKKHDVKVVYYGGSFKVKFRKEYFDPEGRQNIKESFLKCYKCCHQLRDGRLYMCPAVAYIKYMNRFFSTNFEVTPADYIDIYQTKGIKEILGYLNQPIPFCRYCDMGKNDLINWQISKKEISEWT